MKSFSQNYPKEPTVRYNDKTIKEYIHDVWIQYGGMNDKREYEAVYKKQKLESKLGTHSVSHIGMFLAYSLTD